MKKEEIYEKLNEVFRDVFDDETITVNDNTTANDIDGWDSLTHIILVNSIEEEFNIRFSMKETIALKNVGSLVNIIIEKVK